MASESGHFMVARTARTVSEHHPSVQTLLFVFKLYYLCPNFIVRLQLPYNSPKNTNLIARHITQCGALLLVSIFYRLQGKERGNIFL